MDKHYIATQVRLLRDNHEGAIVIVEASPDSRVLRRFLSDSHCRFVHTLNKDVAVAAVETLDGECFPRVLAVLDADFSRLRGLTVRSPNVLFTDSHDLETMMLSSCALDTVLRESASEDKLQALGRDVRAMLLESVLPLGYLRLASLEMRLDLCFDGLSLDRLIDKKTMRMDRERMARTVIDRTNACHTSAPDLLKLADSLRRPTDDPWQVCCGHDVVEALAVALHHLIGTRKGSSSVKRREKVKNPEKASASILEKDLRLAYDWQGFSGTQLCATIREWQMTHRCTLLAT